jgi:hypothetical protein
LNISWFSVSAHHTTAQGTDVDFFDSGVSGTVLVSVGRLSHGALAINDHGAGAEGDRLALFFHFGHDWKFSAIWVLGNVDSICQRRGGDRERERLVE